MLAQRRQQRSGAISLPAGNHGNRIQRLLRRFTSAPAGIISHMRRKSTALLGGQLLTDNVDRSHSDVANTWRRQPTIGLTTLLNKTEFSSDELKTIYQRFKTECPYGLMHEEILDQILAQIFPLGSSHAFAHFVFCCFDKQRVGYVNFEQFACCLNILLKGNSEQRIRWLFSMYDTNGDGEISRREILDFVASIYELLGNRVMPQVTQETVQSRADLVFSKLDVDEDGVVSWNDFYRFFHENPTMMDGLEALRSPTL